MRQWSARGGDVEWGVTVDGGDALVQRHAHMLDTVPGDLGSDPEWGIGIRTVLGRATAEVDARGLAAVYRAQHLRDPETVEVDAAVKYDGQRLDYAANIIGGDGIAVLLNRVAP